MKGGFSNILKQAQQMQTMIEQKQKELSTKIVTGEAGGGLVKIDVSCTHGFKKAHLDPSLKDEELEVIADLIIAACNDAMRKAESTTRESMAGVTAGLNLPAGFNNPFGGGASGGDS